MEKTAAIICPESRDGLEFLSKSTPLVLTPFCGKSLLDHSLTELANKGYARVEIYVSDRPEAVRQQVGSGSKWGLEIAMIPTPKELTPREVLDQKQATGLKTMLEPSDIYLVDRIPLTHDESLFASYPMWFKRLMDYLPTAAASQIGMSRRSPSVWVGTGSQVASSARLIAPCWVGRNVLIADSATIGPNAVVEDQCFIDEKAVIENSQIAQRTYVGTSTDVTHSFAWGSQLLNWKTGNGLTIQDRFLLARLGVGEERERAFQPGLMEKLLALIAIVLTSPILILAALWLKLTKGQSFDQRTAIVPKRIEDESPPSYFAYKELKTHSLRLRRLPRLWSILQGNMTWLGTPPLPPEAGKDLVTEFDRLWLASPCGLASLGDCYQCIDPQNDDARAHATYFAVQADSATKMKILSWLFLGS